MMYLPRALQPGDTPAYVCVLDADGNALTTVALAQTFTVPEGGADIEATVNVRLNLRASSQ